ncbi:hypothetical protein AeNC1_017088, partial [Aphanomyces euteiches]
TPRPRPTSEPTPEPTPKSTPRSTPRTPTPTSETPSPIFTPRPTPTSEPTPEPTPTSTPRTPSPTPDETPSPTRTSTPRPTPTLLPTLEPTPLPTLTFTPRPTATLTPRPTPRTTSLDTPEPTPIDTPSPRPTPTSTPFSTPVTTKPTSSPTPNTTPDIPTTSPVPTPTSTSTSSPVPTPTSTSTSSPVPTPTSTSTSSPVPTPTSTPTTTSPTPSTTPHNTTSSPVPTPTSIPTTTSPTPTSSPVLTPTSTPTTTSPTPSATPHTTPTSPVPISTPNTTPSTTPFVTPNTTIPSSTPVGTPMATPGSTPSPTTSQASPRPTTAAVTQTPRPTLPVTTSLPFVTTAAPQTLSPFVNDLINKRTTTAAPTSTTAIDNLLVIFTMAPPTPLPTLSDGSLAPTTEPPQTVVPRPNSTRRNDNSPVSKDDSSATAISVSGAETPKIETNRYIFSALVGLTLALLAFFHYIAIDPSFVGPDKAMGVFTSPNSWELPTFISFMQCVSLGSFLNINAPHAVYVAFTDSFAWMNALLRSLSDSELKPTMASSLVATLSQNSTQNRRLADATSTDMAVTYDGFGFEQFALRSNLRERDLFVRVWTFFFIVFASLVAIATVAKLVAEMLKRNSPHGSSHFTSSSQYNTRAQEFSRRVVGFVVLLVTAAILPLSLVSTYELMQDINSANGFGSLSGIFALLSLIVLVSLVIGATVAVSKSSEVQLSKYDMKVTFGFLYVNLKYDRRLFCVVTLLVQLLTGVFLAVLPSSQCLLLLILHGVYLLLILGLRPFQSLFMFCMVILFEMCLLVLFGIEYAMVHSDLNAIESKRA